MRRLFAVALTALFSFTLIAPALLADTDDLPACCRKDGKHHCSMMSMDAPDQPSGATIRSARAACPLFPRGSAAPTAGKAGVSLPAHVFYASVLSHPAAHAQIEARYRISFSRASQKRGPPSLLS